MIALEIRPLTMLRSIIALRWHQFLWVFTEWARAFGLVPPSGKWSERVTFVYIYALSLVVMSPAILNTLAGLYAAEAKTDPTLQLRILQTTIPAILAVISVIFIINPWKAWLLRLTYGDMTYLAASPFDRVVLACWRYLEMVLTVLMIVWIPLFLIAPMFGSINAEDVIPNVFRASLAISLWSAPMLALGWHISLQQYARTPLHPVFSALARVAIIAAVMALAATNPTLLLLPGRIIVLAAMSKIAWGFPLLIVLAVIGIVVVARAGSYLSLTRASAGSDVFARIQQLGFMIVVDLRLVSAILSEARSNEGYAVGTLLPARGLGIILARAALYYRRRLGDAVQLLVAGIIFGLGVTIWRPDNMTIVIITTVLLIWLLPPWMARLFRSDLSVAFVSQFIPQPLTRRMLVSSAVPVALIVVSMIPTMLLLGSRVPDWAWGVIPAVWVLSLVGHVEAVGRGSRPGERGALSLIIGGITVFAILWSAVSNRVPGILALPQSILLSSAISMGLVWYGDLRHNGMPSVDAPR